MSDREYEDVTETTVETTTETTVEVFDPMVPAVADLFTPRQRTIIYLLSVMLGAAYGIVSTATTIHWGLLAAYAAWNAGVGLLAVSNVPRLPSHR